MNVVSDVGNACPDIAALDGGSAAVFIAVDKEVIHVDEIGQQRLIADQLDAPTGFDLCGSSLFVLDGSLSIWAPRITPVSMMVLERATRLRAELPRLRCASRPV